MVSRIPTIHTISAPAGVPTSFGEIITRLIPIVMAVAGVVLFGMFIYGGFTWMTAEGDANKTKAAADTMKNAAIGIAIVVGAYTLTRIVGNVLGVPNII